MKKLFIFALAALTMLACSDQNAPSGPTAKNGALAGNFSVAPSKQVVFSQGNLQYQASTQTWRFAEHQWDTIGAANVNVSENYSGWIDLFHGGTGNNPTLLSQNYADYATFIDWGVNAISNGGNKTNAWRTLSDEEWHFIFHDRENAEKLFAFGNVAGRDGVILLPDSWSLPLGVEFFSVMSKGLVYTNGIYENAQNDNYSHNCYNREQWITMERAGAVFLPATGERVVNYGTKEVVFINETSYIGGDLCLGLAAYWASADYKDYGQTIVPFVNFSSKYLYLPNGTYPYYIGCSVRLVKDVE